MNRMLMAIISALVIMNGYASQGPGSNQQGAEKYRYLLNFHITSKTQFCVYGIHDILERFKLDINVRDENGMTPMELAQYVGNEIAVKYFLWRSVKDTNPDLAKTLSENMLLTLDNHSQKVFPQNIIIDRNTTTTTSVPPPQPAPAPATLSPPDMMIKISSYGSPEMSSYIGPKRLKESPKTDWDDDDDD